MNDLGELKGKIKRIQKLITAPVSKRDRQAIVKLLVKFKQNQKKLVKKSNELRVLLQAIPNTLKFIFHMHSYEIGLYPEDKVQQLIEAPNVFLQGLTAVRIELKIARKKVKNKDYIHE